MTEDDVYDIRESELSYSALAKIYDIHNTHARNIKLLRAWSAQCSLRLREKRGQRDGLDVVVGRQEARGCHMRISPLRETAASPL